MNKIQRTTTAELSTSALRQQILNGDVAPGARITEDAMAQELGISRATVRQALNTLVNEGLLVRNPATRVLEVTSLDAEDISEIYRARRVLELAGVEASRTATGDELELLKRAVDGMREAVQNDDVFGFVQADSLCHARTVGFLRSQILSQTHEALMTRLRLVIARREADESITAHGLAQHEEFCRLVLAGQVEQAKANLAERLDAAERGLQSHHIGPGMRVIR
ncbi:GntR family transcriptional regulator [Arthrobacter dokdonensis]|uniref:GntR family transcriptional regulator n=1 Tax=Arthrobacter dokdonellae TaxID=2211210 RepID=UPI001494A192|nr:GntR family transcriptional regulator [Arthrobacter dokdonellae]